MLTIRDCEMLRSAYGPHFDLPLAEAMRQIGNPSTEELIEFAAGQMTNPDRNARVLMLRLLAHQQGERSMRAVLAGLQDDTCRVCAVAIQACQNFLGDAEIVDQLLVIAGDHKRKLKLRRRALSMLAGNEGRLPGDLAAPVFTALRSLLRDVEYRFSILFGLLRLDLAPGVTMLLEQFTRSDDSVESALAARALRGERVIHIDAYSDNQALQREIIASCDFAHGRMYYWLPRTGLARPQR